MVKTVSNKLRAFFTVDRKIGLLRTSIGIIYLWFGILKFFENRSPAEALANATLPKLSFELIPDPICYLLLAAAETLLGLMLILNMFTSKTIKLAVLHLLGTFTPVVLQPELLFNEFPFALTLVGQYILKNLIIICALAVVHSSWR